MAKTQERLLAKELFFQFKTQKEIARIVTVQEKTIGDWIKKFGWKNERNARFNGSKNQIGSIKKLIGILTDERIELIKEIDDSKHRSDTEETKKLQKRANEIADEVSKYNKTLLTLDKENRISLAVYLDVMDSLFKAIQKYDAKLYMKLLTFQEEHLSEISLKLG
jgi:predicted transcriptional regulator